MEKRSSPKRKSPLGPELEQQLIADMGSMTHDPLRYVLYNWPWGEPGTELAGYTGPRRWQRELLRRIGEKLRAGKIGPQEVIREAVASGHGVGKSALVAWLTRWALDTHEDSKVVVTANTEPQLRTKTWPEIAKWHRLSLTAHWWQLTATSIYSLDPGHERTWRADLIPWNEVHPESFQGLHNQGKRILVLFDEASAIHDVIWEATEGALTDEATEILWCVFGNPTRTTGRFRECFGKFRHRWNTWHVDSRDVEGSNKSQIQAWVEDYGEDSDFVRVRVRGLFPRASAMQLIPLDVVAEAQRRQARYLPDDALIFAIDVARGGNANLVGQFRRGFDARSIPRLVIPGSETRDSMRVVAVLVQTIEREKPDVIFMDATGIGGPIADRLRQLGHNVLDVQFGAASDQDPRCANLRTYMWLKALEGLRAGVAIDDEPALEQDLTGPEYHHNKRDQLQLESKEDMEKRGLASPDYGDAFCMTFAYPVPPRKLAVLVEPVPISPSSPAHVPYWARRAGR